jgi:hypothetical protein
LVAQGVASARPVLSGGADRGVQFAVSSTIPTSTVKVAARWRGRSRSRRKEAGQKNGESRPDPADHGDDAEVGQHHRLDEERARRQLHEAQEGHGRKSAGRQRQPGAQGGDGARLLCVRRRIQDYLHAGGTAPENVEMIAPSLKRR